MAVGDYIIGNAGEIIMDNESTWISIARAMEYVGPKCWSCEKRNAWQWKMNGNTMGFFCNVDCFAHYHLPQDARIMVGDFVGSSHQHRFDINKGLGKRAPIFKP